MPSRTATEAVDAYVHLVRRALSCITRSTLIGATSVGSPLWPRRLFIPHGPVRLGMQEFGAPRVALDFQQGYQVVPDPGVSVWRVVPTAYLYSFRAEDGPEILAYHWHPGGDSHFAYPHLHLEQGSGVTFTPLQKAHLPTGLVTLEDIIRLAHDCFGVAWLRQDWAAILGR